VPSQLLSHVSRGTQVAETACQSLETAAEMLAVRALEKLGTAFHQMYVEWKLFES